MATLLTCVFSARCGYVQARLREEARASHFLPKGSKPPTASVRLQICIDTAPVRFVHCLALAAATILHCLDTRSSSDRMITRFCLNIVVGTGGRQDRSPTKEHAAERRVQDSQKQVQEDETACSGVSADR
jgi:hypothetical protein